MSSTPHELSIRALLIGTFLAVVMGAANVYFGLRVGMTVSASIPAAVIGSMLLKFVFKRGSILEANQIQTAASSGESLAAGVIFTIPALVLVGAWKSFDFWQTTFIALSGGLLGVIFMVPLRRVFIERSTLPYPEAVACATVLRATQGGAPLGQSQPVMLGVLSAALYKGLTSVTTFIPETLERVLLIRQKPFYVGIDLSPALWGVGYIVGLQVSSSMFIGGVIAFWIGVPWFAGDLGTLSSLEYVKQLWSSDVRYLGVGAMVVGGLVALVQIRDGIFFVLRSVRQRGTTKDVDLSPKVRWLIFALSAGLMCMVYYQLTQSVTSALVASALMLVAGLLFSAVANYMVGLVGNSNNPVSGMTISTLLLVGLLLSLLGFTGMQGMVATLGVAAVVCCVVCTSGDICNDLKTGQLVGASPRLQQIMQVVSIVAAAVVMAPTLELLQRATPGGIGGEHLHAPQAMLFASLARGFFGDAQLPWPRILQGAALGLGIAALDGVLKLRNASYRLHIMPVAIGLYLPFKLSISMLVGGIIATLVHARRPSAGETPFDQGVSLASGLVAGESLMGVGLAVLSLSTHPQRYGAMITGILGLGLMINLFMMRYRASRA